MIRRFCIGFLFALFVLPALAVEPAPFKCSASHTGGSVSANTTATFTISCPGVRLGDFVEVSANADSLLLTNTGYVSASNTVTIIISNVSAGAITSPTTTYNVRVLSKYVSP
jgi:hypothetical protein